MSIEDKFNFAKSFVIFEADSRYIGQAYALRFSYQSSKNPLPPADEILTALTIPQIKKLIADLQGAVYVAEHEHEFLDKEGRH
ncbi:hypothetical protein SGGMMB4_04481 [Sodalis glossinidius str. 'morsitans']|uniref:Uncharacterized protein n=1 Tax=Sodalis glossinidius (strain morsitans) TaxID=343509 RepID=A0A193QLP4_SODGM|nr:hypothetical protein [Sodalis glossinidius]CRL46134.1 hypothetical protein SGGMMB4_04481 [Sodalis glossinidius str. 'morsitans']